MLLRNHPLKSRHSVPNWPPVGNWIGEFVNLRPQGKFALSSRQYLPVFNPSGSFCALTTKIHLNIGCLLFDDYALCQHAAELFRFCCNRSQADIGHFLPTSKRTPKEERKHGNKTKNKPASLCNTRIVLDCWDQRSGNLPSCLRPKTNHYRGAPALAAWRYSFCKRCLQ